MADIEVTLNHSENYSASTAKTYRGYVINLCDDSHVDDGTWAVTLNSYTGYKINSNKINVWNINTTSSDKSSTFTWTSSKVSGCTKTLSVTVPGAVVTLKSGNTEIVVTAYYSTSTGDYRIYSYQDEFLINGSSNGIVTTSKTVGASPIITCNGGMSEYWIIYGQNNTDNKIHVSLIPNMRTYFIGCTGDYTATGVNTINLKYYDREMTISFPVKFKFICSANYKFYRHESTLVEISSASETYTIDNNHTYSLNDIIRGGGNYYACAESPTDNSISATLFTISNFNSDNSYFTSSSLAINDNNGEPSGRFYIGVKCNTNYLVNLFNGNSAFSATMTFDLSYSNALIPVTINVNNNQKTRIINIKLGLTCDLEYTNVYCDSGGGHSTGVPLKWEIKCNNITEISYKNTNVMTKGLNTVLGNETKIKGYDGIRPSGVVLINMPIVPVLSTGAFTISVSGDGSGSKTFIGKSNRCPLGGANYYTYDENLNNLNLEVPFEVLNDGDEININISVA